MVLREEHNEENPPLWRKRFERERQDLSASVEAALVVDSTLERQWLDEFDEQDASPLATEGTVSASPLLNRQASLLPLILPESPVTVTTDARPAITSETRESAEPPSQRSGILTRLARRFSFTASLPVIDPSAKQDGQSPQSVSARKEPLAQQTEAYQAMSNNVVNAPMAPAEYADTPLVRVIDALSTYHTEAPPVGKKRSLKGNGKVRLETTELPVVGRATKEESRDTNAVPLLSSEDVLQQSSITTERSTDETQVTVHRGPFSGSGVCAGGERDVTVACTRITASSVVLVTLTSNPGPVVVQYISLQPQTGFTLHLTAPVAESTTFNYMVL